MSRILDEITAAYPSLAVSLSSLPADEASDTSGTGGKDTKEYPTAEASLKDLERLGARTEVLTKAKRALEDPLSVKRFVEIAENVQIPFEALERADIYLFD